MQIKYLTDTFRTHVCIQVHIYVCNLILLKPCTSGNAYTSTGMHSCAFIYKIIPLNVIYSLNFSDSLTYREFCFGMVT